MDGLITSTLVRFGTAAALLALCGTSVIRMTRPPAPVPATAPDTVFSAERAMRHVEAIAVRPHAMGMPDHARVRDYILGQLTALGLKAQIQEATAIGTRYQEAGRVQNVLAWLPGSDTKGKAVLLVAHYDGVPAGPAAADDGAGSATLIETLRALRARKQPLAHDVFALFTDGEEAGLLGAAAFVREHPWAKDVAVVINLEARGTSGRSLMFETGPGNLDAVRALSTVSDVSAGSVFTTVYRVLHNDTDLSEFAVLGLPALNFAFIDGAERYHTTRDDVAHLNPGSLQHHGAQMLGIARRFASETLPRPKTGDAVFFDLPVFGLIVYAQWIALPLAIVALVLVVILLVRDRTWAGAGVWIGVGVALISVALSAAVAWGAGACLAALHARLPWGGLAQWSGLYAAAVALLAVAVTLACVSIATRWAQQRALHVGALLIWLILTLAASARSPGLSYLFAWPLLFAMAPLLASRGVIALRWVAAAITLLILAGFTYAIAAIVLGVVGMGGIALGVLASLIALLLMPLLAIVSGNSRLSGAVWVAGAAVVLIVVGVFTVRRSADHPVSAALVYAENADSTDAWFGALYRPRGAWTRDAIGASMPAPAWADRIALGGSRFYGRRVDRVPLGAPNAAFVRDTIINGARRVVLRVTAPPGTAALVMRGSGAPVLTSSIDGRIVDTTRYVSPSRDWIMEYWAVPDSGAIIALSIPAGAKIDFELAARRPGIPAVPGLTIPERPVYVVPNQDGDMNVVYRRFRF
ncbi:MAG: M28 family peptidase [bacterium]